MLNVDTLKDMIKEAFINYLEPAMTMAYEQLTDLPSDANTQKAQKFGKTIVDLCAEPLGNALAGAIDYYVRSMNIYGTIQVTPPSMTGVIQSPTPATNGAIPNTLGIM